MLCSGLAMTAFIANVVWSPVVRHMQRTSVFQEQLRRSIVKRYGGTRSFYRVRETNDRDNRSSDMVFRSVDRNWHVLCDSVTRTIYRRPEKPLKSAADGHIVDRVEPTAGLLGKAVQEESRHSYVF